MNLEEERKRLKRGFRRNTAREFIRLTKLPDDEIEEELFIGTSERYWRTLIDDLIPDAGEEQASHLAKMIKEKVIEGFIVGTERVVLAYLDSS